MKTPFYAIVLALGLITALPASAASDFAYVDSSVNLRTGPAADYPRITTLRAGQRVEIFGCIDDWSWCDVASSGFRGWVSAGYLEYERQGRRVGIGRNGSSLGLPVLSFILDTYWNQHYRDKSWYGQRTQQAQRHPQHANRSPSPQRNASPQPQRSATPSRANPQQGKSSPSPAQTDRSSHSKQQDKRQDSQKKSPGRNDNGSKERDHEEHRPR